ncbi:DUF1835 domain-containing protein [Bradyrhizobium sp. ISRA442]|uniref:DUF1835 domain-containing protein n=1 Tax=Bradyrhizobium sp. ISRA442 TaxID=2866197 RepID=UPI00311B1999
MKRVILTSSSGLCLIPANRADVVVSLIFRFVWGPLPSQDHLAGHLASRSPYLETHWSQFIRGSSRVSRLRKNRALVHFCENFDVVELWFDRNPNDQLQLIWILEYLRSDPATASRLRLCLPDIDLAGSDSQGLCTRAVRDVDVTEDELETASMAWEAYRAPTPEACFYLSGRKLSALPLLSPTLSELLAELPSSTTGLGATEMRFLKLIASGCTRTRRLFELRGPADVHVFDQWESEALLEELAFGPMPAVAGLDEELATLTPDHARHRYAAYRRSRLALTEFGKAVLAGREDFRRHNPIKRWWGGTLLTNERLWRWDAQSGSLVAP